MNNLMVKLKPEFQKQLFSKLRTKYGNSRKASEVLQITHSSFRGYKNGYFNSIPDNLLKKISKTNIILNKDIKDNALFIYNRQEQIKKLLDEGREIRKNKIKEYFNFNIKLEEFIIKEKDFYYIDVKRWLDKTNYIEKIRNQNGFIKNVKEQKIEGNNIILEYETYSRNKNRNEIFVNSLPLKIKVDEEFLYFLGIRYGDGTSGCRIGIINKNLDLIKNVAMYLRKTFQTSRLNSSIYLYKNVDLNSIENFKIELNKISNKLNIYDMRKSVLHGIMCYVYLLLIIYLIKYMMQ